MEGRRPTGSLRTHGRHGQSLLQYPPRLRQLHLHDGRYKSGCRGVISQEALGSRLGLHARFPRAWIPSMGLFLRPEYPRPVGHLPTVHPVVSVPRLCHWIMRCRRALSKCGDRAQSWIPTQSSRQPFRIRLARFASVWRPPRSSQKVYGELRGSLSLIFCLMTRVILRHPASQSAEPEAALWKASSQLPCPSRQMPLPQRGYTPSSQTSSRRSTALRPTFSI